jgi:hypothetical protein
LTDQSLDQAAGARARLADQQTAERVERQRAVVAQDPQYFGLGRGDAERAEIGGEQAIPLALDREHQVSQLFRRLHPQ